MGIIKRFSKLSVIVLIFFSKSSNAIIALRWQLAIFRESNAISRSKQMFHVVCADKLYLNFIKYIKLGG